MKREIKTSLSAVATLGGDVFDDAATGQGLLSFFLRALNCGAISESEAATLTGLTFAELRSWSLGSLGTGQDCDGSEHTLG